MPKEMPPVALDEVFGASAGAMPEGDDLAEDTEADEALDLAIDEVFATEDPIARREAFKNAIRLCKEQDEGY